jgi:hypothetical protein
MIHVDAFDKVGNRILPKCIHGPRRFRQDLVLIYALVNHNTSVTAAGQHTRIPYFVPSPVRKQ